MEHFVIIVTASAANYYHKALHLGCFSSPRSASVTLAALYSELSRTSTFEVIGKIARSLRRSQKAPTTIFEWVMNLCLLFRSSVSEYPVYATVTSYSITNHRHMSHFMFLNRKILKTSGFVWTKRKHYWNLTLEII